ncbi:MAG: carbohydrate kinase family protein [Bacillales bacterium]
MKISIIGGCGIDIIGMPRNKLKFKDSNLGNINYSLGCVGRNIAENLYRLEEDVKLISIVGDDIFGIKAIEDMKSLGINTQGISVLKNKFTATYLAILNNDNDLELAISNMDILDNINVKYLDKYKNDINKSEIIILETNLSKESIKYLLLNNKNKFFIDTVSVVKSRKIKGLFNNIYFLKTNILESEELLNIKIKNEEDIINAGKLFIKKGIKIVAITLGKDGAYIFTKNEIYKANSKKVKVINTTGAGDAFLSGFAKGEVLNLSIEDKIKMAMAASLITVKSKKANSDKLNIKNITKEMGNICLKKIF